MKRLLFSLLLLSLASPAGALALYKDPATGAVFTDSAPNRIRALPWDIDFWGRSYLQYRREMARDPHAQAAGATASDLRRPYDAFEVTRAYLGLRAGLGDWGRFEFLYDFRDQTGAAAAVSSIPASASGYHAAIKAAFIEIQRPFPGHKIRFGQINMPWVGYEERFWPYRVQGPILADREGYIVPTDRGGGLAGNIPIFSQLEYDIAFANGESWNADEINTGKNIEGRINWKPSFVPGLDIAAFGDYRWLRTAAHRTRYIAFASYTRGPVTLGGEYIWTRDPTRGDVPNSVSGRNRDAIPTAIGAAGLAVEGRGYEVFGHYRLPFEWGGGEWKILGRWDHFDPDQWTADNAHDRAIGGLSFRPNRTLMFVVSYDRTQQEAGARSAVPGSTAGRTAADRDMLLFQTQVDF